MIKKIRWVIYYNQFSSHTDVRPGWKYLCSPGILPIFRVDSTTNIACIALKHIFLWWPGRALSMHYNTGTLGTIERTARTERDPTGCNSHILTRDSECQLLKACKVDIFLIHRGGYNTVTHSCKYKATWIKACTLFRVGGAKSPKILAYFTQSHIFKVIYRSEIC